MTARFAGVLVAAFLAVLPEVARADNIPNTILAGSGSIGIADGPVASATFMMPAQLAVGRDGKLYVVDTAAQRIRTIAAGIVSTLAGSGAANSSGMYVEGGFRDGPAPQARFNRPSGIAVDQSDTVYVADRDNHAVRRIAGGLVSTYAGSSAEAGTRDGARGEARFVSPRALALDSDGSLYVADWGALGIRKIDAGGVVTTLPFPVVHATGVAVSRDGAAGKLIVADADGLLIVNLTTMQPARVTAFPKATDELPPVHSDISLGRPFAVAAMDGNRDEMLITDLRDSSVKYMHSTYYLRFLNETPREDAMITGGGSEKTAEGIRLNGPMGVVEAPDGSVVVADTGNRRIVRFGPFERRAWVDMKELSRLEVPAGTFRVALIGTSYTTYFSNADTSIAGFVQRKLLGVPELSGKAAVNSFGTGGFLVNLDVARDVFAEGAVDAVVWYVAAGDQHFELGSDPKVWIPALRRRVIATAKKLRAARIPFVIAVAPSSNTLSPLEAADHDERSHQESSDYFTAEQELLSAFNGTDADVVDLYPAARLELARPNHRPLFNTSDIHLSPYGREFFAEQIFAELRRIRAWSAASR